MADIFQINQICHEARTFGSNKLNIKKIVQAGAELDEAQLKLGLGFASNNLHQIDEQDTLPATVHVCK